MTDQTLVAEFCDSAGDRTVDPGAIPHKLAFPKAAFETASHGADWPQLRSKMEGLMLLAGFKDDRVGFDIATGERDLRLALVEALLAIGRDVEQPARIRLAAYERYDLIKYSKGKI